MRVIMQILATLALFAIFMMPILGFARGVPTAVILDGTVAVLVILLLACLVTQLIGFLFKVARGQQ